jgi:ABC-type glycerol-3-phosphate transport system substrate-binding protein
MNTNVMMRAAFAALVLTTLGLAACSDPTLNGASDAAQIFHHPTGPYDNTANSLGGRWAGGGG